MTSRAWLAVRARALCTSCCSTSSACVVHPVQTFDQHDRPQLESDRNKPDLQKGWRTTQVLDADVDELAATQLLRPAATPNAIHSCTSQAAADGYIPRDSPLPCAPPRPWTPLGASCAPHTWQRSCGASPARNLNPLPGPLAHTGNTCRMKQTLLRLQ